MRFIHGRSINRYDHTEGGVEVDKKQSWNLFRAECVMAGMSPAEPDRKKKDFFVI